MSIKQNILISNSNKSNLYNLNNDIILTFPSNLFHQQPLYLELISFDLLSEITLFGNSNNTIIISFTNDNNEFKEYTIIVDFDDTIKTDYQLAEKIKFCLNDVEYDNYDIEFNVTESSISNVVTNFKSELDASTSSYSILSTKPCNISFEHKDSIGPLIGFGTSEFKNVTEISGTSTQSISKYNYIDSYNESSDTLEYPNYNDINCKMCLFDSNGNYIVNKYDLLDTTISINRGIGITSYDNIGKFLIDIQNNMNDYSDLFTPPAEFEVLYNYQNDKITITNLTGAKFGIGFDFDNIADIVTSGSLHNVLGFEQKTYLNIISITSPKYSLSYERSFAEDYILICSDISSNSSDINIIGIGNETNIKSNDILFAIPVSETKNFKPNDISYYRIDISNSKFSLGYKTKIFNETNQNTVNFYLRTFSGRCVTSTCQWSALLAFTFQKK